MSYEYSPKQKDIIRKLLNNQMGFINILEGSVRSGKTFITNLAWVLFVLNSPYDKFLMSGESTDSLYRNVIGDMIYILGSDRASYQDSSKGGAQLIIHYDGRTKVCYCRGGSKANDEGKIRGITIGGWMADEITLHHESFVKQALSRMSLEGAKAFWTTNPDSPYHYIKTEYIDKCKENGYCHWHFDLDDNLTLSEEYKENIKKAYSGLFYDRFIKGLWVMADGVIYPGFDEKKHCISIDDVPKDNLVFYIPCDYGITNPHVYLKAAIRLYEHVPHIFIVDEYYNKGDNGSPKTDNLFLYDYKKFISDIKPRNVIIDPSATSLINLFRQNGISVLEADNTVIDGISNVTTWLNGGRIHIVKDRCPNLIKEFESYIWDDKAQKRGEDKPLKENDHAMDALRYLIQTLYPLENVNLSLLKGGNVWG